MKNFLLIYAALLLVFCSCKSGVNTYENKMGIQPAVLAQIDSAHYTTIEWKDTLVNFGKIKEGDSVVIKYPFKNTGKYILLITGVQSSCGCTVTSYPTQPIMPGKSDAIIAKFNSNHHPGIIHKTIWVSSNTANGVRHLLVLNGMVEEQIQ
jgi:hypothetical protein